MDAECSFSKGRLEANHLQHNTSLQTFRAKVALETPLWPGLSHITKILEPKVATTDKGKTKEVDIMDVD
jgi:hypothetical protein